MARFSAEAGLGYNLDILVFYFLVFDKVRGRVFSYFAEIFLQLIRRVIFRNNSEVCVSNQFFLALSTEL